MATTNTPQPIDTAPKHDWSAAKVYFIHRRNLDRPHWGKLNYYSRPGPSFFKMPLKSYSHTYHANSETNLLCLPGELILDTLDVLAPLDILNFGTASKYIWSLASTKSVQTRIQKTLILAWRSGRTRMATAQRPLRSTR